MKKTFSRLTNKNLNKMKLELAHAHLIIALLSIAIISLLSIGKRQVVSFDSTLSAICVILLSVVTIISLCVSVKLYRKK